MARASELEWEIKESIRCLENKDVWEGHLTKDKEKAVREMEKMSNVLEELDIKERKKEERKLVAEQRAKHKQKKAVLGNNNKNAVLPEEDSQE